MPLKKTRARRNKSRSRRNKSRSRRSTFRRKYGGYTEEGRRNRPMNNLPPEALNRINIEDDIRQTRALERNNMLMPRPNPQVPNGIARPVPMQRQQQRDAPYWNPRE